MTSFVGFKNKSAKSKGEKNAPHKAMALQSLTTRAWDRRHGSNTSAEESERPLRIAMIGTRGVPARYGGFEHAVEEVGKRLAARGHEVVVYCRTEESTRDEYLGMKLVGLRAVKHRTLETPSHTAVVGGSMLLDEKYDAAIVFNAANAFMIPIFRKRATGVGLNVDGLEWKRSKWHGAGKLWYKTMEKFSAKHADILIADSHGIKDYYINRYNVRPTYIAYGSSVVAKGDESYITKHGLVSGHYHLVVARLEPENNVHIAVAAHAQSNAAWPLVIVGDVPYPTEYTKALRESGDENIIFLGSVWDQDELDQLYAHSASYVHGHSVGGTNPSLLRAMGAEARVLAYDVSFNAEVCGETAHYFDNPKKLAAEFESIESDPILWNELAHKGALRAKERYDWDVVADGYEELSYELARVAMPAKRSS